MNDETPKLKNSARPKSLCKKNCGYYGSIEYKDMCSKCYRENSSPSSSDDLPPSKLKDSKYGFSRAMKRKISETLDSLPCSEINIKQHHLQSPINSPQTQSPNSPTDSCISNLPSPKCISGINNNNSNNSTCKDSINKEKHPKPSLTTQTCLRDPIDKNDFDSASSSVCNISSKDKIQDSSRELVNSSDIPKKSLPNRCHICRKKVGLTGFVCHCEKLCCSLHRYPDQHSCQFDYMKKERAKIAQENPVIQAAKITKI